MRPSKYIFFFIISFLLLACKKDNNGGGTTPRNVDFTLFIYLAGDNSLTGDGYENINLIRSAATTSNIGNGKVIVFQDRRDGSPRLLQISAGENGKGETILLKNYDEQVNSSEISTFQMALNDMKSVAPASGYGLIMWSHGSGWLPGESPKYWWSYRMAQNQGEKSLTDGSSDINPYSVAEDNGDYMEMNDFIEALPSGLFDFIIFDQCYSGGIELIYPLRNKTKQLIVSVAEVISYGMPYSKIIPHIFASSPRLGKGGVCEEYYNHYNDNYTGFSQSVSTALVDCSKVEAVAETYRKILTVYAGNINTLSHMPNVNGIQFYDRYEYRLIYDLVDFAESICPDDNLISELKSRVNNAVTYKAITDILFYYPKDKDKYSGISAYIPFSYSTFNKLNNLYTETDWYKTVYPSGFLN